MIFAVLEDWYHHIVFTHSYKLESFFTYMIYKVGMFNFGIINKILGYNNSDFIVLRRGNLIKIILYTV